jgi:hypothetical protein
MIKIKILTEASPRTIGIVRNTADHIRNPAGAPFSKPSDQIRRVAGYNNLTPSETEKIVNDTRPYVKPTPSNAAQIDIEDHNFDAILTMGAPKYKIGGDNSKATGGLPLLKNYKYDLGKSLSPREEEEIAAKIVNSISQLKAFKITRALFAGTKGFIYQLSNDHILKFYLDAYADDQTRFNNMKNQQTKGKGTVRDPSIIDDGEIEIIPERKETNRYGQTIEYDAITLKFVEMSKLMPFGEFANMTMREPDALSQQINFIGDNFYNWMEKAISEILITSSKWMNPEQRATLTDVYDTLSNMDPDYSSEKQRRDFINQYRIKERFKTSTSSAYKQDRESYRENERLTWEEFNSAVDMAIDNFIREGNTVTGDFHAGNFGVSLQHGFKNPLFIVFDK